MRHREIKQPQSLQPAQSSGQVRLWSKQSLTPQPVCMLQLFTFHVCCTCPQVLCLLVFKNPFLFTQLLSFPLQHLLVFIILLVSQVFSMLKFLKKLNSLNFFWNSIVKEAFKLVISQNPNNLIIIPFSTDL